MTEGCPENLNLEFLLYVLNFRSAWRGRNAAALAEFDGEVLRFASPAETQAWLDRLGQPA